MTAETADDAPDNLEAVASLELLVTVAHRCGLTAAEILTVVQQAVRSLGDAERHEVQDREFGSFADVLTLWHTDAKYVDDQGDPVPLRMRGPGISFEALVRKFDRDLDAKEVLRYLERAQAVKFDGDRYHAIERAVILRGVSGANDFHHLRGVHALLLTIRHNTLPADQAPVWLQRLAENDYVPVRRLKAFGDFLQPLTMDYLQEIDTWLLKEAEGALPGEPTCKVSVGTYRSQRASPKAKGHGKSKRPP